MHRAVPTLTLGSFVSPLTNHSSTSAGASTEVELAASTKGSLMIFTVNSFVARMFSLVSLGFFGDSEKQTLNKGGLWETYTQITVHSQVSQTM